MSKMSSRINNPKWKTQPIKIYCRFRPVPPALADSRIVHPEEATSRRQVVFKHFDQRSSFSFNYVFHENAQQFDVFNVAVAPLVNDMENGFNGTVFTYGARGSGKTFTVYGALGSDGVNLDINVEPGMIGHAASYLFGLLSKFDPSVEQSVKVSFIELYNEEVYDLLNDGVCIRTVIDPANRDLVYFKGLTKASVSNLNDVHDCLTIGLNQLYRLSLASNNRTNRSHTIFTFTLDLKRITSGGEEIIRSGSLQFIEISRCENAIQLTLSDLRNTEGANINRSIITLNRVMRAVSQKITPPFQESILTRIMRESLAGNCSTALIATFFPISAFSQEIFHTLYFLKFARSVITKSVVNIKKQEGSIFHKMKGEIEFLQVQLEVGTYFKNENYSTETFNRVTQEIELNNLKINHLIAGVKKAQNCLNTLSFDKKQELVAYDNVAARLANLKRQSELKSREVKEHEMVHVELNLEKKRIANIASAFLKICSRTNINKGESCECCNNATSYRSFICPHCTKRVAILKEHLDKMQTIAKVVKVKNEKIKHGINNMSSQLKIEQNKLDIALNNLIAASSAKTCIEKAQLMVSKISEKKRLNDLDKVVAKDLLNVCRAKLNSILSDLLQNNYEAVENMDMSFGNRDHYLQICQDFSRSFDVDFHHIPEELIRRFTDIQDSIIEVARQIELTKLEEYKIKVKIEMWQNQLKNIEKTLNTHLKGVQKEPLGMNTIKTTTELCDLIFAQRTVIDTILKCIENNDFEHDETKFNEEAIKSTMNGNIHFLARKVKGKIEAQEDNLSSLCNLLSDLSFNLPGNIRQRSYITTNYLEQLRVPNQQQEIAISDLFEEAREDLAGAIDPVDFFVIPQAFNEELDVIIPAERVNNQLVFGAQPENAQEGAEGEAQAEGQPEAQPESEAQPADNPEEQPEPGTSGDNSGIPINDSPITSEIFTSTGFIDYSDSDNPCD